MVVVCCVGANGPECALALVPPYPCACGNEMIQEGVEVYGVEFIMGKEKGPSLVTEFS